MVLQINDEKYDIKIESVFITCIQCETEFEFTVKEQEKFQQRGFDPPLRCPICRKNKDKKTAFVERRKFKDKKRLYRQKSEEYFD